MLANLERMMKPVPKHNALEAHLHHVHNSATNQEAKSSSPNNLARAEQSDPTDPDIAALRNLATSFKNTSNPGLKEEEQDPDLNVDHLYNNPNHPNNLRQRRHGIVQLAGLNRALLPKTVDKLRDLYGKSMRERMYLREAERWEQIKAEREVLLSYLL